MLAASFGNLSIVEALLAAGECVSYFGQIYQIETVYVLYILILQMPVKTPDTSMKQDTQMYITALVAVCNIQNPYRIGLEIIEFYIWGYYCYSNRITVPDQCKIWIRKLCMRGISRRRNVTDAVFLVSFTLFCVHTIHLEPLGLICKRGLRLVN